MAQTLVQSNIAKPNHHKTILQRLEGLKTQLLCTSCRTPLGDYPNFDAVQVSSLIASLTGSCPACHHLLKYNGDSVRFLPKLSLARSF